jgi:hypothetical protein
VQSVPSSDAQGPPSQGCCSYATLCHAAQQDPALALHLHHLASLHSHSAACTIQEPSCTQPLPSSTCACNLYPQHTLHPSITHPRLPAFCTPLQEIYRVLKPGGLFAGYEWLSTAAYNPENKEHKTTMAEIELGNGLPDVRSIEQVRGSTGGSTPPAAAAVVHIPPVCPAPLSPHAVQGRALVAAAATVGATCLPPPLQCKAALVAPHLQLQQLLCPATHSGMTQHTLCLPPAAVQGCAGGCWL